MHEPLHSMLHTHNTGVLTELNGVAAVVGVFSRRAHKNNTMPLSGTQSISTIWNTSNTNIHGVWIFDIGLGAEQTGT